MRSSRELARRGVWCATAVLACVFASSAAAYDPATELSNFSKINERYESDQANPEYQLSELTIGSANSLDLLARDAEERDRLSLSLCASGFNGCAGDVRVYDWAGRLGVQQPFVYVNRNGSHIEGHTWVSARTLRRGKRVPGIVIETGSVQAPERLYWWAAQVLAAHGYLVTTFDVQGQGRSDTFGSGAEMFAGVPAQDGVHFVEDLEDALDFFHSTRAAPYVPSAPGAASLQDSEVAAGDTDAFNPIAPLLDRRHVGIAGHSLGAFSASVVQGTDPRVDALVAWDNLSAGEEVTPRIPALGMSADYFLVPTPYTEQPDPLGKNEGFVHWQEAGVDAMQVNLRGGTHYEWSYISNPAFPASLRGIDTAAWYTTAWFDKYLKADPSADRRLLTRRWEADPLEAAVDPGGDGNMLSFYFRSSTDFSLSRRDGTLGARRAGCDDMRAGCGHLRPRDGEPTDPPYSFLEDRG